MIINVLKTCALLSALGFLLIYMGQRFAGSAGMAVALGLALVLNFATYFYSDKLVLTMHGAQPLSQEEYGNVYDIVADLAGHANLPMPKLWLIPQDQPNAFATGRSPEHASIGVTRGILKILNERELRGVLAHELSHVKNRDILIGTIAATIATTIAYMGSMLRWSFFLGGGRSNRDGNGIGGMLVAIIVVPMAATLIQMAVSRSREYGADETGATISHDPLALADALEKIERSTDRHPADSYAQASVASLYISNPFTLNGFSALFSTHPSTKERVKKLRSIASQQQMRSR